MICDCIFVLFFSLSIFHCLESVFWKTKSSFYINLKLARKITLIKKEHNFFSFVQLVSLFEVYIKKPHTMPEYILTSLPTIVKIQKSFGKLLKWLRKRFN